MCGAPIARAATGRPRRYCSGRCRQAAARERAGFAVVTDVPVSGDPVDDAALRSLTIEAVAAELDAAQPSDPVGQLARAVSETEGLAVAYGHLARKTPRGLGWRASGMADHLRSGLERYFPREDRA
jgi:hypothetical protein